MPENEEKLKSLDKSERGEWKRWCKTQQSKNKDHGIQSHQFSSVAQSCPTLWDPMYRSTPGLPVHHQLSEFTQTHVHRVSDAIQLSHPLSSPSPPAPNTSFIVIRWGNNGHCENLFSWAQKSLQMVTSAMNLKDACSLKEKLWQT